MGGCFTRLESFRQEAAESAHGRRGAAPAIRFLHALLNFVFLCFAIFMILIGAFTLSNLDEISDVYRISLPVGAIVLGCLLLVASVFGCIGVKRCSVPFLWLYVGAMTALLLAEIGVGIAAVTDANSIPPRLRPYWQALSDSQRATLQSQFSCCGWANTTDLAAGNCTSSYSSGETEIPYILTTTLPATSAPPEITSCQSALDQLVRNNLTTVAVVLLVFGLLQITGVLFALMLIRLLRRENFEQLRQHEQVDEAA